MTAIHHHDIRTALEQTDPDHKIPLIYTLHHRARTHGIAPVPSPQPDLRQAGRPARPQLVPPQQLDQRGFHTPEGYAALLHAICHIEYNAINLALDAAWRFPHISPTFTLDWLQVAAEEARHFTLMRQRLRAHGFDYGDFPAHNGLWEMADKTAYDPLLRMALVPRVLEARGLDVTPAIRAKVQQKGDRHTATVLDIIYRDEIGHVRLGNRWYDHLCQQRGLDPIALFRALLQRHDLFIFRGHINHDGRNQAGFSEFELSLLEQFEHDRQHHPQTH